MQNEKPDYIAALENEILTLTPEEAVKVAEFVGILRSERTLEPVLPHPH
jgi:hypothetical protein